MTDKQREKRGQECRDIAEAYPWLAEEIAAVAEAAYRRGYQQGAISGANDYAIAEWRFKPVDATKRYKTAATPPKGRAPSVPAIRRHRSEAANASYEVASIMRWSND